MDPPSTATWSESAESRGAQRPPQEPPRATRRSERIRRNVDSEDVVSECGGRKASDEVTERHTKGPGVAKAPGEERQCVDWGVLHPGESADTYTSRVVYYLKIYEEAGKELRRVREALRRAEVPADTSKGRRQVSSQRLKELKVMVQELEEKRAMIMRNGGHFMEKFANEERFSQMKGPGPKGLQPSSAETQRTVSGGGGSPARCSSSIPAEQVPLPSTTTDEEESPGGHLVAEIRRLESPDLSQFYFGDDEVPDEKMRKARKTTRREEVRFTYVPLEQPAVEEVVQQGCTEPDIGPSPVSDVGPRRTGRESEVEAEVSGSTPACSSGGSAVAVSAKRPNKKVGAVSGALGAVSGASVAVKCPSAGKRRGAEVSGAVPRPIINATEHIVPAVIGRRVGEEALGSRSREGLKPAGRGADADGGKSSAASTTTAAKEDSAGAHPGAAMAQKGLTSSTVVAPVMVRVPASPRSERVSVGVKNGGANGAVCVTAADVVTEGVNSAVCVTAADVVAEGMNGAVCVTAAAGGVDVVGDGTAREGTEMEVSEAGSGPSAPPAAAPAPKRSYASVAALGSADASLPAGSGSGDLQRCLLEALRQGKDSIEVEGEQIDLSFWKDRHGLSAFREQRGGETVWSLPTTGPGGARRNVVRLRWRSNEACPPRGRVVELLLGMGFVARDIFALIHPYGTTMFDVSFVRPEGLELFWSKYELAKNGPEWRAFAVQAITRQNAVKRVTVLTSNESLSCVDIMLWLSRYGEVHPSPVKNLDEHGIWSGAWSFMVKLKVQDNSVTHIPSSTFLGRDRILIFYRGQPKVCYKCGSPTHFSAHCDIRKCAMCGEVGHLAASCGRIRCNLCGDLGHPYSRCPRSFANTVLKAAGVSQVAESAGEGNSGGGRGEGPGKKSKTVSPSKIRRQERRQKAREEGTLQVADAVVPAPGQTADLAAEDPRDSEVDEEVEKLLREEITSDATVVSSSYGESLDEDHKKWLEGKRKKQGAGRKKKRKERGSPSLEWDPSVPLTLGQVQEEGSTVSPLFDLSNRYHGLHNISPSSSEDEGQGRVPKGVEEAPPGGAESPLSEGVMPSGEGTKPGSAGKDVMDTSACLKRQKEDRVLCSSSEGGGGGKKKAI